MRKRQRVFVIARPVATGLEALSRDGVVPVFNLSAAAFDAAAKLIDPEKDGDGWLVCPGELNFSSESAQPVPLAKKGV